MLQPTADNLLRWSRAGVACSLLQCLAQLAIAVDSESPSLAFLVVLAVLFAMGNAAFHAHIRKHGVGSDSYKYFYIIHVIVATWCFGLAMLTLALHGVGISALDILTDSNDNDLTPRARQAMTALLVSVTAGLVVDAYSVWFHTRRLQGKAPLVQFPRPAAVAQVLVDVVMITVSAVALQLSGHLGCLVPLLLALLSAVFQLHHLRNLSNDRLHLDSAPYLMHQHVYGQLLSLQHALLASLAFLLNLAFLLMFSLGHGLTYFLSKLPPISHATMVLGFVGYLGLLGTSIVVVGLVTQLTADADGSMFTAEAMAFTVAPTDSGNANADHVALWGSPGSYGASASSSGPGSYSPAAVAVPLPSYGGDSWPKARAVALPVALPAPG